MSTARFLRLLVVQVQHQLTHTTDEIERAVLSDQLVSAQLALSQLLGETA
jgi:hypothetical protein